MEVYNNFCKSSMVSKYKIRSEGKILKQKTKLVLEYTIFQIMLAVWVGIFFNLGPVPSLHVFFQDMLH